MLNGPRKVTQKVTENTSLPAGDDAEWGEGEQRGSEGSSGRADREAALPADPGGGAGESAQTGELGCNSKMKQRTDIL